MAEIRLKGELTKATVHIERELYMRLKIALAVDELTLSGWFRDQVRVYVQARLKNVDLKGLISESIDV